MSAVLHRGAIYNLPARFRSLHLAAIELLNAMADQRNKASATFQYSAGYELTNEELNGLKQLSANVRQYFESVRRDISLAGNRVSLLLHDADATWQALNLLAMCGGQLSSLVRPEDWQRLGDVTQTLSRMPSRELAERQAGVEYEIRLAASRISPRLCVDEPDAWYDFILEVLNVEGTPQLSFREIELLEQFAASDGGDSLTDQWERQRIRDMLPALRQQALKSDNQTRVPRSAPEGVGTNSGDPLIVLVPRIHAIVSDRMDIWREVVRCWAADRKRLRGDDGVLPIPFVGDPPLSREERMVLLAAIYDECADGMEKIDPWREQPSTEVGEEEVRATIAAMPYTVVRHGRLPDLRANWATEGWKVEQFLAELEREFTAGKRAAKAEVARSDGGTWQELFEHDELPTQVFVDEDTEPGPKPVANQESGIFKRSTSPGSARAKIQGYLLRHHGYDNGKCANYVPLGVRELAANAEVADGSVTHYFNAVFMGSAKTKGGFDRYVWACNDRTKLDQSLKMLAGDLTPHILWMPLRQVDRDRD